jgi:hypothetical protein
MIIGSIRIAMYVWCIVLLVSANIEAVELKVLTEDLVPFNYMENNEITGFTAELDAMKQDGMKQDGTYRQLLEKYME